MSEHVREHIPALIIVSSHETPLFRAYQKVGKVSLSGECNEQLHSVLQKIVNVHYKMCEKDSTRVPSNHTFNAALHTFCNTHIIITERHCLHLKHTIHYVTKALQTLAHTGPLALTHTNQASLIATRYRHAYFSPSSPLVCGAYALPHTLVPHVLQAHQAAQLLALDDGTLTPIIEAANILAGTHTLALTRAAFTSTTPDLAPHNVAHKDTPIPHNLTPKKYPPTPPAPPTIQQAIEAIIRVCSQNPTPPPLIPSNLPQ